jgi:hypothetical protein
MQVLGDHWVEGKVETHLSRSYRDLVAKGLYYVVVVADREWIIGILVRDSGYVQAYIYLRGVFDRAHEQESKGLHHTVYHVGQTYERYEPGTAFENFYSPIWRKLAVSVASDYASMDTFILSPSTHPHLLTMWVITPPLPCSTVALTCSQQDCFSFLFSQRTNESFLYDTNRAVAHGAPPARAVCLLAASLNNNHHVAVRDANSIVQWCNVLRQQHFST